MKRPVIGVTPSLDERDLRLRRAYAKAIARAGGLPVVLTPAWDDPAESARAALSFCDAVVLTGGDDPATERYGEPTHPAAKRVHPDRQAFEEALLDELSRRPEVPVLGICLGMQMMALAAGGSLIQHMPDEVPTHAEHMDNRAHAVLSKADRSVLWDGPRSPDEPLGAVTSWHRQAVRSAGRLRTVAAASDGVIEAIDDPGRPFWLGVQWHPERTDDEALGLGVFRRMIGAVQRN